MSKVRIYGLAAELPTVLATLQDLGIVHLDDPPASDDLRRPPPDHRRERHREQLERALDDAETALAELTRRRAPPPGAGGGAPGLLGCVRLARRLRRTVDELADRRAALAEERGLLVKYGDLVAAFGDLPDRAAAPHTSAHLVLLRRGTGEALDALRRALTELLGEAFEMRAEALPEGRTALLILTSREVGERVEALLAASRVEPIPVPEGFGTSLAEALPRMRRRLAAIPSEMRAVERASDALARRRGRQLQEVRRVLRDQLALLAASRRVRRTAHTFILDGWVPAGAVGRLTERLAEGCGQTVAVEVLSRQAWAGQPAPVALSNPRLLRPFETLLRFLPVPRYGSIDPTPFVAVFFPMLFGLILGDVGYGMLLALAAWILHRRSAPGGLGQSLSRIAGACALFSVVFGLLYGELLGDLGRRWLGLRPLLFDRGEALLPFLGLVLALGAAHLVLGLCLGAVTALRREPRRALGRGVAALMVVLVALALLAAFHVLPAAFFTPTVVLLLVAFPLLVAAEGAMAPFELLSTLGHVLSYARVMALGTASVMLAVVANRMVGAVGSAAVGVVFALLFHLVNFAVGVFSPTLHALRLHYVEFFGTFYSPGGVRYRPLAHWIPAAQGGSPWSSSGSA